MMDIKTNNKDLKILSSVVGLPKDQSSFEFDYYIGPYEFDRLKAYDNGLEQKIISFGFSIFGKINRYIFIPSFDFLSTFISSKGIVIIVLIFIIKMLLYPLLYKMLYGQAKMTALKSEVDKLKEKNKDDAQKHEVVSRIWFQSVIWLSAHVTADANLDSLIALYRFFPASITFLKEPFLSADDL